MMTKEEQVSIESTSPLLHEPSVLFDIRDFHGFEKSQEWNYYIHCDACDFKTSSRPLMLVHIETRHTLNEANIEEEDCDDQCHHSQDKLKKKYFNCGECGFKTTSQPSLVAHHAASHSSTIMPTLKRKKNVADSEQLEESILICALCGYETKNSDHMKKHQKFHSKKSAFTCPICSFSVLTQYRLTYHMNRVHPSHNVPNGQEWSSSATHQILKSKQQNAAPKKRPESKPLKCALCDFYTWKSIHMKEHDICHQRNQKIKCHLCSFSSNSKYGVSVHLNRHHQSQSDDAPKSNRKEGEGELPRQKRRLVTTERARDEDSAGNHAHEVEEPSTASSNNPRINLKLDHYCKQCDFASSRLSELKKHNKNHEMRGKFKCHLCNYSSDSKASVTYHSKYFHKSKSNIADVETVLQSDQEPSEEEELNPRPNIAKVSLRVEDASQKKRTGAPISRSTQPISLLEQRCFPFQRTKFSNKNHCGWLVKDQLVNGSPPSSPAHTCSEPSEMGKSNIVMELTLSESHNSSVPHEKPETSQHPASPVRIQSALTVENDGLPEPTSSQESVEATPTMSQTSGNETTEDVAFTDNLVIPEVGQSSYSPIPHRCEYTSIKETCCLASSPMVLVQHQEQVPPTEIHSVSTAEGTSLPQETAEVHSQELANRYTLENEEAVCRAQLSRHKLAMRSGRLSIRELYSEVLKQRQHHYEKEMVLNQLRIDVRAQEEAVLLADNILKETSTKMDQILAQLHGLSSKKLESDYKLKKLENEATVLRIATIKPQRTDKQLNDLVQLEKNIASVKDNNNELQMELVDLSKEEVILANHFHQASYKSERANKLLRTLCESLKALELDQRGYSEEKLNHLIISTEQSVRSYFKSKNWLFEIQLLKRSKEDVVDLSRSLESLRNSVDFDFL